MNDSNQNETKVLERMVFEQGLRIDHEKAWTRLVEECRGNAQGAFIELIQNALDSYDGERTEAKRVEIESGADWVCVRDWGTGLQSLASLELLTRLGGTTKRFDRTKIGKFGIGFLTLFARSFQTRRIGVTVTNCEGATVQLSFNVITPGQPPQIEWQILEGPPPEFSTEVRVEFGEVENTNGSVHRSVRLALVDAADFLRYFPCQCKINGDPVENIWAEARSDPRTELFEYQDCQGIARERPNRSSVQVLCMYQPILGGLSLLEAATGGRGANHNLDDLVEGGGMPYLDGFDIVVNCDQLRLTLDRRSYYINNREESKMKSAVKMFLLKSLSRLLEQGKVPDQVVLANIYVMRHFIARLLAGTKFPVAAESKVAPQLADAKVFRISGQEEKFSLREIKTRLTSETPLFFSPLQRNLRWLGGNFKHDFILLPESGIACGGARDFYGRLLEDIFRDVVDLDEIEENPEKIADLVKRGIVDESSLSPLCKVVPLDRLGGKDRQALEILDRMLARPQIKKVIFENLVIPPRNIESMFFEIIDEGVSGVAAALFSRDGLPLDLDQLKQTGPRPPAPAEAAEPIFIGLRRGHPFINYMVENIEAPNAVMYALAFVAHELVHAQKVLRPHGKLFYLVAEKLGADMRKALMEHLISQSRAA